MYLQQKHIIYEAKRIVIGPKMLYEILKVSVWERRWDRQTDEWGYFYIFNM